jgi:hypothetical protein
VLHGNYFGQRHTAELLMDGTVRYGGQVYSSLSAAGAAVKVAVHGPDISESTKATDGLVFWHAEDARAGDVVSLKESAAVPSTTTRTGRRQMGAAGAAYDLTVK